MGTFGINSNRVAVSLGRLSTQAINPLNNTAVAAAVAQSALTQNTSTLQGNTQAIQTNSIVAQVLPPVVVNQALLPSIQATNPTISSAGISNRSLSPSTVGTGNSSPTISSNLLNSSLTPNASLLAGRVITADTLRNPITNIQARRVASPVFRIPTKTAVKINKTVPPHPDTLKLSEIKIDNNTFVPVPRNGLSAFRPEILGMVNFNPLFWPENKSEFTESGQYISMNYQAQVLRKNTLDKIMQKIRKSNDRTLIQPLTTAINNTDDTFKNIEKSLNVFANNSNEINEIKNAFNIKGIENNAYKTSEFLTLAQFFEKRMQYNNNAYAAFSDTKILMQLLFDLRSSLEDYSLSLLNLTDDDRKNDLNPITLDKTYTRNSNFTFSIESIRSTGPSGRLAMDSTEFTQFINSLPSNLSDRLKLSIHLLSKELRISRNLTKSDVRNKLTSYYSANPDGNPFDNIIGSVGNDIFDKPEGVNSLASLMNIEGDNFTILPFETKTVDDSQTTYIPGSRYFGDSVLSSNGQANLAPFNSYTANYSAILANAKNIIEQLFEFTNQNSKLDPENVFLDFLQALQDSLSTLGSSSNKSNTDQLIIASLLRLANKDNILKLMVFQFFLLTGIASINKQDNKKIFQRLIEDTQNQIRKFSYVRTSVGDNPDLTNGLQTLRPYLERLAEDIETRVFTLLNPHPVISFVASPTIRSMIPPQTDVFSAIINAGSNISFGTVVGDSNRINSTVNSSIQSRVASPTVKIGVKSTDHKVSKGSSFDRGAIKNILLSSVGATNNAATNLLKEFVDLSLKFDNESSIQGNNLSYVLANNSTRFNFISTSHILLFVFEILCSFIGRFFIVDFTEVVNFSKISLSYDNVQNKTVFDYIRQLLSQRKTQTSFAVAAPVYLQQRITPTPPPLTNLSISPAFAIANRNTTANPIQSSLSALNQISSNIFAGIAAVSPVGSIPRGNTANTTAATSLSVMLENISNMSITTTNSRTGQFNQRIGFAGAITREFKSPNIGIESIKNAINANVLPLANIAFATSIDPATLRKLNDLKQNLAGILDKLTAEDVYVKNSMHILDVVGDRLSLVNTRVNNFYSSLDQFSRDTLVRYKDTIQNGQIRASNWIQKTYKQNVNTFGSFNSVYRDEYFAMISLLSDKFYTNDLANNRVKLLAVGVPAGFNEKLIDRISRNDINAQTFSNSESDVVYISVYKRNSANDDIVYYPQKILLDLSLFPKELTDINLDPKMPFERQLDRMFVYDFQDTGNIGGNTLDLATILSSEKYSFLSTAERREMFRNHITSYLLQTYTYLLSGISFSEEVFPSSPYKDLGQGSTLPATTESLLRAYFKAVMGFDYPAQTTIVNALTDPTIPSNVKDDIQLMLYGSNILKPSLVEAKVLERKKFDRIFMIPINIDNFAVNTTQTLQTASGKRAFSRASYQKQLTNVQVGNNTLYKENRDTNRNALIFEEYFVTIETAKKV